MAVVSATADPADAVLVAAGVEEVEGQVAPLVVAAALDREIDRIGHEAELLARDKDALERLAGGGRQGRVDDVRLGEDVADVALLHQPVDVVLDHPQVGELVADPAQGFGRDQVGVAEHDQVGADGEAEVEKGAVGRLRAGGQMAEQGAGARDVAVGEVRHRVAVANEPVGDLVLDPVLEGALGFSAEV